MTSRVRAGIGLGGLVWLPGVLGRRMGKVRVLFVGSGNLLASEGFLILGFGWCSFVHCFATEMVACFGGLDTLNRIVYVRDSVH